MCVQHVCIIFACLFIPDFFQGLVTNALITQKRKRCFVPVLANSSFPSGVPGWIKHYKLWLKWAADSPTRMLVYTVSV